MLTENNFHHHSHHHHNSGSVIPQHRTHYAPYQHPIHPTKSLLPVQHQQVQQQQQPPSDIQLPKFDLHHAVRTNDVSGIIRLHSRLRQQPMVADTCLLDSNGHTPLYAAIANGRLAIVDLLLHLGHNPVSNYSSLKLSQRKKRMNQTLGGDSYFVNSNKKTKKGLVSSTLIC